MTSYTISTGAESATFGTSGANVPAIYGITLTISDGRDTVVRDCYDIREALDWIEASLPNTADALDDDAEFWTWVRSLEGCDYCGATSHGEPIILSVNLPVDENTHAAHFRAVAIQDDATHYCALCGARYAEGCSWT